ncbi:hypothetical protein [Streptomyces prasinopilosus]|uniref:hypothetical protein n=1 Tax=Streptomyces prasinopilosus TaxID=67344 RepID=UPI0006EB5973|nr:hypothetical protein [Streptomyces prasinopilosus]
MTPSPEPLPPFSGNETACPKCSYDQAYTEHKVKAEPRTDSELPWNSDFPERLERRCARCDFIWDEALNPPTQGGA